MTNFITINCVTSKLHKYKIEYNLNLTNTSSTILIHGFNDFHYNKLLHEKIIANKSNVFLLTLRNYNGLQEREPQFYTNNLKNYFHEINDTIEKIMNLTSTTCKDIYLMGHSTGGLISIAYCHEGIYKSKITKLILNSPFLDFNNSCLEEIYLKTIGQFVGYFFPLTCLNATKIDNSYPKWMNENISKDLQTTEFNEVMNSTHSIVNVSGKYYGWMYATRHYHWLIQNNYIKLNIPIHVFRSNKTGIGGDNTLDTTEIKNYSSLLTDKGNLINHYFIINGLHNVFSSDEVARTQAFGLLDKIYNSL